VEGGGGREWGSGKMDYTGEWGGGEGDEGTWTVEGTGGGG